MEAYHQGIVAGSHLDSALRQEALAVAGGDPQLEEAAQGDQRHQQYVEDAAVAHHWSSTSSEQKPGPIASKTP